jgi:hypothetical protein
MEAWRHGDMKDGDINMETWRLKRKMEVQAIFLHTLPCNYCTNESLSFVRFVDDETNGSYPFAN